MNQRDRLHAQKEYVAWGRWKREGSTTPGALGYGSSTPIGSLLSGELGGGGVAQSKVPLKFNEDPGIDVTNRVFGRLHIDVREVICGIFADMWSEQLTADRLGISRRQVRNRLDIAYLARIDGERTEIKNGTVASG